MPREACGARDGPSRRAPGATMERGNPGAAGAGCRGKPFWFLLGRLPKETRREAKQKLDAHSEIGLALDALATRNADITNEFAPTARAPAFHACCVPGSELFKDVTTGAATSLL